MKLRLFLSFLLSFLFFGVNAQKDSLLISLLNKRSKKIRASIEWQQLDTLHFFKNSFECFDVHLKEKIPSYLYSLDNNKIKFKQDVLFDSVFVFYKVFPYNLEERQKNLDTAWIRIDNYGYSGLEYNPFKEDNSKDSKDFFNDKKIDYQGSFERGISFGNNQNLSLNSSFNLQLAGQLGNDIEILGAISDQNIPLQPEGNTQQLQDFDRIFIQLKKGKQKLIAGDYELQRPKSYFVNYLKKLQGATLHNEVSLGKYGDISNKSSVAISKGKFARNILKVQEGNQGPYLLQGGDGERFIVVLSGTEKVYFNGLLLLRGNENDYVIDYNRGEIIFTPKRLMTKDARIIIEFEYSDQNYLRSLYAVSSEYQKDNLSLRFNFFSEQDSRTSSIQQDLTDEQRRSLVLAGDSIESAFISGIDTLTSFQSDRVLYKLVDTFYYVNGVLRNNEVLLFSTNPDSAKYSVRFSYVGEKKGNYKQIRSFANGRVYSWVAPDANTGALSGDYEPIVKLFAPKQQQMASFSAEYKLKSLGTLGVEGSFSRNDKNRFSNLDKEDDVGKALYVHYINRFELFKYKKDKIDIQKDSLKRNNGFFLETRANYEFKEAFFKPLNPYRNIEFSRDWNIQGNLQNQEKQEHLLKSGFSFLKDNVFKFEYDFLLFKIDSIYNGVKHSFNTNFQYKSIVLKGNLNHLSSNSLDERSIFIRPKLDLSKKLWKSAELGIYGEREKNSIRPILVDTLSNRSFYYDFLKIYFNSPQFEALRFSMYYSRRWDYVPILEKFKQNTQVDEVNFNGFWNKKQYSQLVWNFSYRNLQIKEPSLTNQKAQLTYLGRMEHNLVVFKGSLRSNVSYEVGAGQEPKREFTYQLVNVGEGQYQWIDYNNDRNKQLNEFELAAFRDSALYVRVPLFNSEFIKTNNVQYNHSLRLSFKQLFEQNKADEKQNKRDKFYFLEYFLKNLSTETSLRIARKTQDVAKVLPFNPFQLNLPDSSLVSLSYNLRNVVFFNRSNAFFDMQFGITNNKSRNILISGYESRKNQEQFLKSRWNLLKSLSIQLSLSNGKRNSDSELFNNRDYDIFYYKIEPQTSYYFSKNFRGVLGYSFSDAKNQLTGVESSKAQDANLELTYNRSSDTSMRLKFSFIDVRYTGARATPVEFALLQGLRDGSNYVWSLSLDRRVAKNILLNIGYDGRKTGSDSPVVHTGRASVRAIF